MAKNKRPVIEAVTLEYSPRGWAVIVEARIGKDIEPFAQFFNSKKEAIECAYATMLGTSDIAKWITGEETLQ